MTPPADASDWTRLELLVALPGPPEAHKGPQGEDHYLIRELKAHARFPHLSGAWVYWGHTIMSSPSFEPIGPDTDMCAHILHGPVATPIVPLREALECRLSNGEIVRFLTLIPIYREELEFKLEHGGEVLLDRLHQAGVTEVYDPDRPPPSASRRRGGVDWKRLLRRRT
jgi:hypothetical protein